MEQSQIAWPDIRAMRKQAIGAGGIDPMSMRFRVVEYRRSTGKLVGVAADDSSFFEAVENTKALIQCRPDSHFFLEPIGFIH